MMIWPGLVRHWIVFSLPLLRQPLPELFAFLFVPIAVSALLAFGLVYYRQYTAEV